MERNDKPTRDAESLNFGRLTEAEYRALQNKLPWSRNLGRLTDEEYNEMWEGKPPK